MKDNHLRAINWINERLKLPTCQIVIGPATYLDLNFTLELYKIRITQNNGCSHSAFKHTKEIKDYFLL